MLTTNIVTFQSRTLWQDAEGKMWCGTPDPSHNVLNVRHYDYEGTPEEFLDSRPDLKFMIQFHSADMQTVINKTVEGKQELKAEEPAVETPMVETPIMEETVIDTPPADETPVEETKTTSGIKINVR